MTDERRCELSALLDGELDAHRQGPLWDRIGRDPGLSAAWERWHLIGQALRGEPIDPAVRATAEAVRGRLGAQPAGLGQPARRREGDSRLAPFAGAALAAAAALLAVLAAPVLYRDAAETGAVPLAALPVPVPAAGAGGVEARRWHLDRPELASKLDLFLVNHQETAPAAGVKGMLPYAALVGYEGYR
jgi:sigma-E factor negative regulatory protein RseA